MAIISSGQITIIDLYDAPSLNAWISASQSTTQTYNNTTQVFSPNYVTSPQVLKLNLTKAGSATSLIGGNEDVDGKVSSIKWTKREGTTSTVVTSTTNTDNEYKSGTSNSVLTTKANTDKDKATAVWVAEGIWTDPNTNLPVTFSATIDLNVIQLAKASVIANMYAPDGDFFRNNTPASLKINADLYKDGALSTGGRKYKWFVSDSSLESSEDSDAGVGWRKITATSGVKGAVANYGFDVETTSQGVLTVYPDAVLNSQTFLVVITDNTGGTAGTKVKQYLTLKDLDDPIMVIIDSSDGNILKNGTGSTTLTARLWRNGEEIDTGGTIYTYKWYRWENNKVFPGFGGTGINFKTGKTLPVGSDNVNVKTTFKVEVEAKK